MKQHNHLRTLLLQNAFILQTLLPHWNNIDLLSNLRINQKPAKVTVNLFLSDRRQISLHLKSMKISQFLFMNVLQQIYLRTTTKHAHIMTNLHHVLQLLYLLLNLSTVCSLNRTQSFKIFIKFLSSIVLQQLILIFNLVLGDFVLQSDIISALHLPILSSKDIITLLLHKHTLSLLLHVRHRPQNII